MWESEKALPYPGQKKLSEGEGNEKEKEKKTSMPKRKVESQPRRKWEYKKEGNETQNRNPKFFIYFLCRFSFSRSILDSETVNADLHPTQKT